MSLKRKNEAYVVWAGRKPGVYATWDECRAQVDGYPNAKFRGFRNRADALAFQKTHTAVAKPHMKNQIVRTISFIFTMCLGIGLLLLLLWGAKVLLLSAVPTPLIVTGCLCAIVIACAIVVIFMHALIYIANYKPSRP